MAKKTGDANGNYGVSHANFVLAYSKDNLAHLIYPGGVSKDDWVHDLPLLIQGDMDAPRRSRVQLAYGKEKFARLQSLRSVRSRELLPIKPEHPAQRIALAIATSQIRQNRC